MDSEDSDIGGYDSSDDEDYVPEGCSDDDEDDIDQKPKKIKSPKKKSLRRKTRRGIHLQKDDSDESEDECSDEGDTKEEIDGDDTNDEEIETKQEDKKRINAIWESMKNETENYDEKEQPSESKEIRDTPEETKPENELCVKENDTVASKDTVTKDAALCGNLAPKKRPGGLSSVLGSIGKKQKMSTLEKSKNDWNSYKKDRGIEDELRTGVKDGFLAKQEFLQRVDYRTWENEREMRLATSREKK